MGQEGVGLQGGNATGLEQKNSGSVYSLPLFLSPYGFGGGECIDIIQLGQQPSGLSGVFVKFSNISDSSASSGMCGVVLGASSSTPSNSSGSSSGGSSCIGAV